MVRLWTVNNTFGFISFFISCNQDQFGEKNEIMFYSEKDKLSLEEYQKDNAVYYQFNITISNIKKIKPNGVSIFNFTMPESTNKDINYRIYVKNDDKEYWV